ncbi:serine hydrolase [Microbacterium suwonense]|nr:serine hydrolase [Microbacterium suwonense]
MTTLDTALAAVDDWPVDHAAAAVISRDGTVLATHGDLDRSFRLASVTKPLTAYATLVAVEEGCSI